MNCYTWSSCCRTHARTHTHNDTNRYIASVITKIVSTHFLNSLQINLNVVNLLLSLLPVSCASDCQSPVESVRKLADFLKVDATDKLCADIAEACSFENLKKADDSKDFPKTGAFKDHRLRVYRKGKYRLWPFKLCRRPWQSREHILLLSENVSYMGMCTRG